MAKLKNKNLMIIALIILGMFMVGGQNSFLGVISPADCTTQACKDCVNKAHVCTSATTGSTTSWYEKQYEYINGACGVRGGYIVSGPYDSQACCTGTITNTLRTCQDTTPVGQCSKTTIYRMCTCQGGASILMDDCAKCGCPSGMTCNSALNLCEIGSSTTCTPNFEVCSDGTNFNTPVSTGDVYKCNAAGTKYEIHTACSSTQKCTEYSATVAQCDNAQVWYCPTSGTPYCQMWQGTGTPTDTKCKTTQAECEANFVYCYATQKLNVLLTGSYSDFLYGDIYQESCEKQLPPCAAGQRQFATESLCRANINLCNNGICSSSEDCSSCPQDCKCASGATCSASKCVCALTCTSAGYECGVQKLCGEDVNCGTCAAGKTCVSGTALDQLGAQSYTAKCLACTPQCADRATVNCGDVINPSNNCGVCESGTKCASGTCQNGKCSTPPPSTCSNGVKDGDETGVDCGGSCTACKTTCKAGEEIGDDGKCASVCAPWEKWSTKINDCDINWSVIILVIAGIFAIKSLRG